MKSRRGREERGSKEKRRSREPRGHVAEMPSYIGKRRCGEGNQSSGTVKI